MDRWDAVGPWALSLEERVIAGAARLVLYDHGGAFIDPVGWTMWRYVVDATMYDADMHRYVRGLSRDEWDRLGWAIFREISRYQST